MKRSLLACGIIIAAVLAAYHAGFSAPFIFDDGPAIVDNPSIRDLGRMGQVLSPPPEATGAAGRPLVNLTLAINYAIGGLDVRGYHALNLLIHLCAALTLFGIVRRTLEMADKVGTGVPARPCRIATRTERTDRRDACPYLVALTTALLWAVHPLLTESVMGVVQRSELLVSLFYLLTLYCFMRGSAGLQPASSDPVRAKAPHYLWHPLAVLCCLLGMASKEVMVSAPLIVWLYDRTFVAGSFREAWSRRRGFYLGLAGTWLVLAGLMMTTRHRGGSVGFGLGVAWWQYALTQCRAIVLYLKLSLWPHPLVIDYGTAVVSRLPDVAAQAVVIALLLAGTVVGLMRRSVLGFAGAWFFAILGPSSSVVPLVTQPIAEHRMYLPLAALVALAVVGLRARLGARSFFAWAILALILAVLTARRTAEYLDPAGLWRGALAVAPDNARAYIDLGKLADQQGRTAETLADYEQALRCEPNAPDVHHSLGVVLDKVGRTPEALQHYQEAVRFGPGLPITHYALGLALLRGGRREEAVAQLEEALRLQPDSSAARRYLAAAHDSLGAERWEADRLPEARAEYARALQLQPNDEPARRALDLIEALERK